MMVGCGAVLCSWVCGWLVRGEEGWSRHNKLEAEMKEEERKREPVSQ